jgi:TonB family protein
MKTQSGFMMLAALVMLFAGCGEDTKGPGQQLTPPSVNATKQQSPPTDFIAVDKEPTVIKKVEPVYPELAMKAGLEGKVWVKIWVDIDGSAKQVDILKSDSDVFNQACIDAARQFLFTPAYLKDKPVGVWVSVPFKFKLADKNRKSSPEEISFMQGYMAAKQDALLKMEEEAVSAEKNGVPDEKLKARIQVARQEVIALKDALKAMQGAK